MATFRRGRGHRSQLAGLGKGRDDTQQTKGPDDRGSEDPSRTSGTRMGESYREAQALASRFSDAGPHRVIEMTGERQERTRPLNKVRGSGARRALGRVVRLSAAGDGQRHATSDASDRARSGGR